MFPYTSRVDENGQIGVVRRSLVGEIRTTAVYHALSWMSHKCKRRVKSVQGAEILAAPEGKDEGELLSQTYSAVSGVEIKIHRCVDSKQLFTSLSAQSNSIDRSIRYPHEI